MTKVELRWDDAGLVPAVVQDASTGQVLMLGFMSRQALDATVETGWVHFYSRSRKTLWRKGETSGHGLRVVGIAADCDGDALLVQVVPEGPTCHTGETSCFFRPLSGASWTSVPALPGLLRVVVGRKAQAPAGSYTAKLLADPDEALKKLAEEAVEVLLAAKGQGSQRLVEELADLLYHLAVVLVAEDVSVEAVNGELRRRGLLEAL
ncbi:MAG: bifunctional phosphoribosyl-AMP cyclohydrolase/phosphoribosyl-ATP diphosphatase HisIE [Thermoanaerobaculum sp.]